MSQEMEHSTPFTELGGIIAQQLRESEVSVPSLERVTSHLRDLLCEIQKRDRESNDDIAEYIRNCREWTSFTRDGVAHLHYNLDTYIDNGDGSITYLMIDHAVRKTEAEMDLVNIRDDKIREIMLARMPRLVTDEELTVDDLNEFVVGMAKTARVTLFKPDAMAYLTDQAVEGTPIIDLLRFAYVPKRVVAAADQPSSPWEDGAPDNRDDIYRDEIIHSVVMLQGKESLPDPEELIQAARSTATDTFVESVVHAKEWHVLYNRYRYDTSITSTEAQAMHDRMRQIMDENGHPEVAFDDWTRVLPLADTFRDEVAVELGSLWNPEVFEALLADLAGNGLFLEAEEIAVRISAAESVRARVLAQNAYRAIGKDADD